MSDRSEIARCTEDDFYRRAGRKLSQLSAKQSPGLFPLASAGDSQALHGLRDELTRPDADLWKPRFAPLLSATGGGRSGRGPASSNQAQGSQNWCGAWVSAVDGQRFTEIWGSWVVPEVSLPKGAGARPHQVSIWVGLDGERLRSRSMPQLGTTVVARRDGSRHCLAWHQWWERDARLLPVTLDGFPLKTGDEIICGLTVDPQSNGSKVVFYFKNMSQRCFTWIPWDADVSPAEGASAEWIVERPTDPDNDQLFPLPCLGEVEFSGCGAVMRKDAGSAGEARNLSNARLIRLHETAENPQRSVVVARPFKLAGDLLRVQPIRH
jgi:hypothetical protein